MKHSTVRTEDEAPITELAQLEQQFETLQTYEESQLSQRTALRAQHDNLLRGADPTKLASLSKASTKLRAEIAELDNGISDTRDLQDRLWQEILTRRQQLSDAQTLQQRQDAAHVVSALAIHATPIERLGSELVAAIARMRIAGTSARSQVEPVMQVLNPDPMIMEDMRQIVLPRASATGPEVAAAIATILYAIAHASGVDLDAYVTFSELNRGHMTMTEALAISAATIASRLGVEL